jgi:hypothetical protein
MKKDKPIAKKMFKIIRTEEGFKIQRLGFNPIISQRIKNRIQDSIENNNDFSNMYIGEEMMVIIETYTEEQPVMIDKTYIKLKDGEIDPSLQ